MCVCVCVCLVCVCVCVCYYNTRDNSLSFSSSVKTIMSARNNDISYSDVAKGEGPAAKRQAAVQAQLQAQQQAAELSEKISTVAKTNHQSPTLPRGKNPFQIAAKRAQQRKKRRLLGGRGGAGARAREGGVHDSCGRARGAA